MTEFLKLVQEFLSDNAMLGNLSAIITSIGFLTINFLKAKADRKLKEALAEKSISDNEVAQLKKVMALSNTIMSNMFVVAFGNSKLSKDVKCKLNEYKDELFKLNCGLDVTDVAEEKIEIKEEVVEQVELKEEKSVLDQMKEEL